MVESFKQRSHRLHGNDGEMVESSTTEVAQEQGRDGGDFRNRVCTESRE